MRLLSFVGPALFMVVTPVLLAVFVMVVCLTFPSVADSPRPACPIGPAGPVGPHEDGPSPFPLVR